MLTPSTKRKKWVHCAGYKRFKKALTDMTHNIAMNSESDSGWSYTPNDEDIAELLAIVGLEATGYKYPPETDVEAVEPKTPGKIIYGKGIQDMSKTTDEKTREDFKKEVTKLVLRYYIAAGAREPMELDDEDISVLLDIAGKEPVKRIDRETNEDILDLLRDEDGRELTDVADDIVKRLGYKPYHESPFPDINPGWHRSRTGSTDNIHDGMGRFICTLAVAKDNIYGDLIIAAPDLMKELYAAYTDSTDKTAMGAVLRKAGVML